MILHSRCIGHKARIFGTSLRPRCRPDQSMDPLIACAKTKPGAKHLGVGSPCNGCPHRIHAGRGEHDAATWTAARCSSHAMVKTPLEGGGYIKGLLGTRL